MYKVEYAIMQRFWINMYISISHKIVDSISIKQNKLALLTAYGIPQSGILLWGNGLQY